MYKIMGLTVGRALLGGSGGKIDFPSLLLILYSSSSNSYSSIIVVVVVVEQIKNIENRVSLATNYPIRNTFPLKEKFSAPYEDHSEYKYIFIYILYIHI